MKCIDEVDLQNKRVILRCDFNVPIEDRVIQDDSRIVKSLKTIHYLLDQGCSLILMSHLGRIKQEDDISHNSLKIVSDKLSEMLGKEITFFEDSTSHDVLEKANHLNPGEIIFLENTRFCDYPEKLESKNDLELASFWASLGDVFVVDAFASMHRIHASTAGISNYLPTYYGFLVKEEVTNLTPLITDIKHPFTVFMGASKMDDKIIYMKGLLKNCDHLLLGGGVANTFLYLLGEDIGDSIHTSSKDILEELRELLTIYKEKIVLPTDFLVTDHQIRDIGTNTILKFQDYYRNSKTIFMNGTPGQFEKDAYSNGTKSLLKSLREVDAFKVAGGGATLNAVSKFGYQDAFTYLSSGGGASLEYVSSGRLAAVDYIENHNKILKKI